MKYNFKFQATTKNTNITAATVTNINMDTRRATNTSISMVQLEPSN